MKKLLINNQDDIKRIKEEIEKIYMEIEKIDIENKIIINKLKGEI